MTAWTVAVVGGECTGKTALCQALAARLPGLWVPEYLREFVDALGRPPLAAEQAVICTTQIERESGARLAAQREGMRWVAADSAPIATAIYSDMYFRDRGLYAFAADHHATYRLTLVTDIDLIWTPDGFQRDGPAVRSEFHRRILEWLDASRLPYVRVTGAGPAREHAAIVALRALESAPR
jgi:nicotinamide riboside kinase